MGKEGAPPLKKEKRKTRAQVYHYFASLIFKGTRFQNKKKCRRKSSYICSWKKSSSFTSTNSHCSNHFKAPEEVRNLIAALKKIVEKEADAKKASEIEENIFKVLQYNDSS